MTGVGCLEPLGFELGHSFVLNWGCGSHRGGCLLMTFSFMERESRQLLSKSTTVDFWFCSLFALLFCFVFSYFLFFFLPFLHGSLNLFTHSFSSLNCNFPWVEFLYISISWAMNSFIFYLFVFWSILFKARNVLIKNCLL